MLRYHGLRKGAAMMLDGCGKCMGGGKNSLSDEGEEEVLRSAGVWVLSQAQPWHDSFLETGPTNQQRNFQSLAGMIHICLHYPECTQWHVPQLFCSRQTLSCILSVPFSQWPGSRLPSHTMYMMPKEEWLQQFLQQLPSLSRSLPIWLSIFSSPYGVFDTSFSRSIA